MNLHLLIEKFESFAHSHISLFKLIALSIVVLSALGLTACGEDEPEVAEEAALILTPSIEELNFDNDLSDIEFTLASNADVQYKVVIPSDCQWLSVDKSSGSIAASKSVTLKFSVDRKKVNAGEYGTTVTVRAGEKEISLPVALVVPLEVAADVTNLDFGTDLSEMKFTLASNADVQYKVVIPSDCQWLSVDKSSGSIAASKSVTLKFSVDRKKVNAGEYGTTVAIKAGEKEISLPVALVVPLEVAADVTNLDFGTDLSEMKFTLASNADVQYKVVIPSDCQWLSVDKSSGSIAASKSVTLKFSVDRKKVNAGEYGTTVAIKAGEKEISLPVALVVPLEVTADVTNLDFGTDLSEMRVNIKSNGNVQLDVTIPSDYGWLMVTPNTANLIAGSTTVLNFKAIRKGLYPGNYSSNIVVRAGDKTLMLNALMEVTKFDPYGRCGSITPCDSRLPVTFTGCRRVGNDVVLEYTVTNNGPTAIKMFKLWTNQNYTSFIDNHHNSYTNLTGITHTLGSNSGTGDIYSPIPQGGTIRCKSVVKNVASAASSFDVVTLRLYNYGTGDWQCANKTVTLRNVVWE